MLYNSSPYLHAIMSILSTHHGTLSVMGMQLLMLIFLLFPYEQGILYLFPPVVLPCSTAHSINFITIFALKWPANDKTLTNYLQVLLGQAVLLWYKWHPLSHSHVGYRQIPTVTCHYSQIPQMPFHLATGGNFHSAPWITRVFSSSPNYSGHNTSLN